MKRLLKALLLGAAATGAAYVVMYLMASPDRSGLTGDRRLDDPTHDDLTREEKEALLRELGTYL
ncbi:MAG TPA: hypothetical protein VF190_07475 [Rhodothermales bacterium]